MTSTPTSPETAGLLVLGSGPAGVHAATAYVRAGGSGPVVLLSADRDEPYQRPPLSKSVLAGEDAPEPTPVLEDDEDLAAFAQVDLRLGTRVASVDTGSRRVGTDGGGSLSYDRLVVATGASPVELDGVEAGARVFPLRTLEHGKQLVEALGTASSAVVVGSGFIGCEAAASLAGRGVRTTLVTPEPAPQAARLGDWAGERIAAWLRDAGVELRTEREVTAIGAPATVRLDDDSEVAADLVLVAVGVAPSTGLLGSSLTTEDDRVLVEASMQTSDERVWAAGDVAKSQHPVAGRALSVEHWYDAEAMGRTAGRNAAAYGTGAEREEWSEVPGFWSDIGEHTLKYSAWGDGYDHAETVDHGEGAFTVWYADAAGRLVGVLTHERDEDYERGSELMAEGATLAQATGSGSTGSGS
ncbi:NAD(P)/FAD-dependent oxidoreductase [Nocardioides aurantiacus]|uniref:NADPH-dependent 2,4-dienoyl-CoA reductase/sulfur reductase-like enzyme n=1 Tax=Nocardioides aurantiacus TaxID=86796 RepID=A0A3N2CSB0_9ACTN|nr:FAD-dependent oxidoreductase [Nocardioides aurantiacus]ROR90258.1 NADPH-dependent 2,4-dienoyl-CoA reductase/sulfur reductase-like enzyme [Nocardioides aurantiacus]